MLLSIAIFHRYEKLYICSHLMIKANLTGNEEGPARQGGNPYGGWVLLRESLGGSVKLMEGSPQAHPSSFASPLPTFRVDFLTVSIARFLF